MYIYSLWAGLFSLQSVFLVFPVSAFADWKRRAGWVLIDLYVDIQTHITLIFNSELPVVAICQKSNTQFHSHWLVLLHLPCSNPALPILSPPSRHPLLTANYKLLSKKLITKWMRMHGLGTFTGYFKDFRCDVAEGKLEDSKNSQMGSCSTVSEGQWTYSSRICHPFQQGQAYGLVLNIHGYSGQSSVSKLS